MADVVTDSCPWRRLVTYNIRDSSSDSLQSSEAILAAASHFSRTAGNAFGYAHENARWSRGGKLEALTQHVLTRRESASQSAADFCPAQNGLYQLGDLVRQGFRLVFLQQEPGLRPPSTSEVAGVLHPQLTGSAVEEPRV
jgi:hypothetical protein